MKHRNTKPNVERRTLGYIRVSTEDQAISLDAQEARIRAYAVAMDWTLSEVIRDPGCSGKDLQRPGMTMLLAAVERGEVERIIVAKLDRLTRSSGNLDFLLGLLEKHDVSLVSIGETLDTSTASGRMVVGMLGVVAQWEREAIVERTTSALSHKRSQLQAYGRVPFGYRREGDTLVPEPSEQAARTEAVRMDKAGHSFREIGRFLNE